MLIQKVLFLFLLFFLLSSVTVITLQSQYCIYKILHMNLYIYQHWLSSNVKHFKSSISQVSVMISDP